MCLFKKRKKELDEKLKNIENSVANLKDFIASHELVKLQEKSRKLSETEALLKNISIHVKNAGYFEDDNGHKHLKVVYYIPSIIMDVDEEYNIQRNEMFRSLNMLNLVSPEDWNIIQTQINKINNDKKAFRKALDKNNKKGL